MTILAGNIRFERAFGLNMKLKYLKVAQHSGTTSYISITLFQIREAVSLEVRSQLEKNVKFYYWAPIRKMIIERQ
jgi:hypothetical protein